MSNQTQKILKFWERWYPSLIATILTIAFYIYCSDKVKSVVFTKDIVNTCITISGILFGFLLTVLALLLQSDSKAIILIKEYGRFGELVLYNKLAVYSAALTLILSSILLVSFGLDIVENFWIILLEITKIAWVFFVLSTITKTYRYIDIFYSVIKT